MPRVEGVVAEHVKPLDRKVVLADVINVFVVAPGEHHVVEPASLLVHPGRGLVARVLAVGVRLEESGKDDLVGVGASRREGVPHHRPLRLPPEAKNLAKVMNQAGQDEPARMAVAADLLRRLKEVLELGKICVGIAVIDQLVEILHRLPDPHGAAIQPQEFLPLRFYELMGLVQVVQAVELPNRRTGVGLVVAELLLLLVRIRRLERSLRLGVLRLRIPLLHEVFPLFKALQGSRIGGGGIGVHNAMSRT